MEKYDLIVVGGGLTGTAAADLPVGGNDGCEAV